MTEAAREPEDERKNRTAKVIRHWLASKGIKRLRSDRRVGLPEKKILEEWAGIVLGQEIEEASDAEALVDRAVAAANRGAMAQLELSDAADPNRCRTVASRDHP